MNMYYLQIVRTQYRIPNAITYLDFAILQYYSLQHYSEDHTDHKAANLWTLKELSYSENFIRWYLVFLQNEQ